MSILSCFSIGFTIVGAFIGAGFVSGQELWQFFGRFGIYGIFGLLVAVIFISLLTYAIIRNAVKTGAHSFETLIVNKENPLIKKLLITLETVFYLCIYVIMTAGAQSLMEEAFGLNKMLVGIIFVSVVTLISVMGVKWLVSVFSATVPILTISVLIIAVAMSFKNELIIPEAEGNVFSAMFSAITFVSYNFIAGIGVFASLSKQIKSRKKLTVSCIVACVFLFLLGIAILLSIYFCHGSQHYDLPMINVVNTLNKTLGAIYSILLISAMLGSSIASLFPIAEILKRRRSTQIITCMLISLASVGLSFFGFKELINTIYPAFGYIGFIVVALVIYNSFKKEGKK